VPPPPRPATVRRMARAGVPLGGPTPPVVVTARPPAVPQAVPSSGPQTVQQPAAPANPQSPVAARAPVARPPERGAWTLAPDSAVTPATAEAAPDGTRSVLSAAGGTSQPAEGPQAGRPGPAVTQPPVELLPAPEAK